MMRLLDWKGQMGFVGLKGFAGTPQFFSAQMKKWWGISTPQVTQHENILIQVQVQVLCTCQCTMQQVYNIVCTKCAVSSVLYSRLSHKVVYPTLPIPNIKSKRFMTM